MIEVMDDDGQIKCRIHVTMGEGLITRTRARNVMLALLELQACGLLTYSTEPLPELENGHASSCRNA